MNSITLTITDCEQCPSSAIYKELKKTDSFSADCMDSGIALSDSYARVPGKIALPIPDWCPRLRKEENDNGGK